MKKILVAYLLSITAVSYASAEERWVEIGTDDDSTTYVNVNSIQRKGEIVSAWFRTISPRFYVKSSVEKRNFNCRTETFNIPISYNYVDMIFTKPASIPKVGVEEYSFADYGTIKRMQLNYVCRNFN